MAAPTPWPTVQPRAAVGAKPTALSAQSLSGLRRVLQRTLHRPLRETVRYHSRGVDHWLPPYGLSVPPRGHMGRRRASRASYSQQKWLQPWTFDLLRIVLVWCLFSLLAGAIVWKCVYPCSLQSLAVFKPNRAFLGANSCESKIIARLSTLQMSA